MKTQNGHHAVHQLPRQEKNWGATSTYKDGWQEDAVRDVTGEVKDRAKKLPEAMYAGWKAVLMTTNFWTSPARGDKRLTVHSSAYDGGEERQFLRVDDWGPMDDSRGRCLQTWQRCAETNWEELSSTPLGVRESIRRGVIPCRVQCEEVLKHFFREHDVDDDLPPWVAIWTQEKKYARYVYTIQQNRPCPIPASNNLVDEPTESVDYESEVDFQIYSTFKVGPGTSEIGDTSIYTRTVHKCNSWFRYASYIDPQYGESDNNLDYTCVGGPNGTPQEMMHEVI